jgi:Putative Actinobacterial Holin-X, holin superfamily III
MTSHIPGVPNGDLLQPLTEQLGAAVHREVERVWQETTRPYRESRTGVRLLGGSAVLGSMAAGSATALLIRLLDRRMPPTMSAAVTAAVLGAGAAVMAQAGRARLRGATAPGPVAAQGAAPPGPAAREAST